MNFKCSVFVVFLLCQGISGQAIKCKKGCVPNAFCESASDDCEDCGSSCSVNPCETSVECNDKKGKCVPEGMCAKGKGVCESENNDLCAEGCACKTPESKPERCDTSPACEEVDGKCVDKKMCGKPGVECNTIIACGSEECACAILPPKPEPCDASPACEEVDGKCVDKKMCAKLGKKGVTCDDSLCPAGENCTCMVKSSEPEPCDTSPECEEFGGKCVDKNKCAKLGKKGVTCDDSLCPAGENCTCMVKPKKCPKDDACKELEGKCANECDPSAEDTKCIENMCAESDTESGADDCVCKVQSKPNKKCKGAKGKCTNNCVPSAENMCEVGWCSGGEEYSCAYTPASCTDNGGLFGKCAEKGGTCVDDCAEGSVCLENKCQKGSGCKCEIVKVECDDTDNLCAGQGGKCVADGKCMTKNGKFNCDDMLCGSGCTCKTKNEEDDQS